MSEFTYWDEVTPFTEKDWDKCMEVFKQHRSLRSELYGTWLSESEGERKLRELAEAYHTSCNAYDKRVCSGTSPRTGEAIPLTHDEMRDTAIAEGECLGFTRKQVEEAIRKWVR